MTENQIGRLLAGVWADLHQPAILWQAATLVLCLLAAFRARDIEIAYPQREVRLVPVPDEK